MNSSSKGVDVLSVLTHILGQSVPRRRDLGEFVCGKCVCVLERVFKFDTVIARVRVLSSERLQKLTQERDKIRQWVRQSYRQRHPHESQDRGSGSEEDGEPEKEGYRDMLRDNMALSQYECWSEMWDACPHFIRTGKRCRKGKGCEGCDSLRVSDSDYESVCGVPRHLPFQPMSLLSRDKSQSMPLDWQRAPSISYSLSSPVGSTVSLHESVHSLDSLDCKDPFDSPNTNYTSMLLRELRSLEVKSVSSPSGSRIPVLSREGAGSSRRAAELSTPLVTRVLNFGSTEENGVDDEDRDVLTELRDDFVPLRREVNGQICCFRIICSFENVQEFILCIGYNVHKKFRNSHSMFQLHEIT